MSADLNLTMDQLEGFFQENQDNWIGAPSSEMTCPIARYFKHKRDVIVIVSKNHIQLASDTDVCRELEDWERLFVEAFDDEGETANWFPTGKDALVCLEYAEEQAG